MTTLAAEKITTECHRCQGTGALRHLAHIAGGLCFLCGGTGRRQSEIKPSSSVADAKPCKVLGAEQGAAILAHVDLSATAGWCPSMEPCALAHITRDGAVLELSVDIEAGGERLIGGMIRFSGRRGAWTIEAISDGLRWALPPARAAQLLTAIER